MHFRHRGQSEAHLDITPIVDTVFNLLIFFALSLNFIVTPGIKVNLPESTTEEIIRERDELVIVMDSDQAIFVNEKRVSSDQLTALLTQQALKNADTLVIIQADQDVTHGNVVRMMDLAKKAGMKRLAIATSLIQRKQR